MDYDSLQKAGSGLGSGADIVMDEPTCMVRACQRIARLYFQESCGKSTPCREGTGWMFRMVQRIVNRQAPDTEAHSVRHDNVRTHQPRNEPNHKKKKKLTH